MEIRQLRYLVGVSEAGGVLPASKVLHIAQPALSQQISALEEELGVSLFVRSNKGMRLTEAGKSLVEHSRIVLADIERARSSVRNIGTKVIGEVIVGLPTTVALLATLPILQATRERYPDIRLTLVESHSGFLREWLQEGRLDLALLFQGPSDAGIEQRPLLQERLALVTPHQSGGRSGPIGLQHLAGIDLVLPSKGHGLRRIIDEVCARERIELRVIAEVDSLPNIKKVVQAGMAATILSPGAVSDEIKAGHLALVPLNRPFISRQVTCATSLTRPITKPAAVMIDVITEQLKSLVLAKKWPAQWIGA
jgi:LysR family transcriptional regulator, nitrogen assimilation regulatory protein